MPRCILEELEINEITFYRIKIQLGLEGQAIGRYSDLVNCHRLPCFELVGLTVTNIDVWRPICFAAGQRQ